MSKRRSELEGRLDGLLSRIAMETQEIKELEQLLTDGQILANEVLKRDLEGVICGLQKYLGELKQQAQSSQQQVDSLQSENQTLRLHLEDAEGRYRQLEQRLTQEAELERSRAELRAVQQERDVLRQQLDSLGDDHRRSIGHLNRKVRQLRRSMSDADQLTAERLTCTTEQLRALNYRMELLQTQVCADRCEEEDTERRAKKKNKKLRLENSDQRHRRHGSVMQVCDEVECVEKTLLKRRAELREADRRLLEAQRCVHATRDQAAELQHRVEDSATCLLEAAEHLRTLQDEEQQLTERRQKQQRALVELEEMLRRRNEELQQLNRKTDAAADRLADVLSDCQEAQRRLDSLTCQEKQREAQSREEERRLAALKAELSMQRAELKRVLLEQQALTDVKHKRTQKEEELQQEVGNQREEASSHLKAAKQHQRCRLKKQQQSSAVRNHRPDLLTLR
ncbi:centriolin [Oryzias latipes]|uniref:centriolin n=1 Tax=Oryzias latipes TaxID=8090 RepID=UPI0005CC0D4D|nr:centriolin [Oryzias latipes]